MPPTASLACVKSCRAAAASAMAAAKKKTKNKTSSLSSMRRLNFSSGYILATAHVAGGWPLKPPPTLPVVDQPYIGSYGHLSFSVKMNLTVQAALTKCRSLVTLQPIDAPQQRASGLTSFKCYSLTCKRPPL